MRISEFFKSIAIASLITCFAVSPLVAVEDADIPAEGITQGDFALWLVEAAGAQGKLPPAALAEDAMQFLSSVGFKPKEGWDKDKKLTRQDLIDMLGISAKEAEGKSWADLIKLLVQSLIDVLQQLAATQGTTVSPSVSPGGYR